MNGKEKVVELVGGPMDGKKIRLSHEYWDSERLVFPYFGGGARFEGARYRKRTDDKYDYDGPAFPP